MLHFHVRSGLFELKYQDAEDTRSPGAQKIISFWRDKFALIAVPVFNVLPSMRHEGFWRKCRTVRQIASKQVFPPHVCENPRPASWGAVRRPR